MRGSGHTDRARRLRRASTDAERQLWHHLRARQLNGYKFRRQHPIGRYFADFCCMEAGLVVEVDGSQHAAQEIHDLERTAYFAELGLRVIRFWNNEVLADTPAVLEKIVEGLRKNPSPQPSPRRGEGEN